MSLLFPNVEAISMPLIKHRDFVQLYAPNAFLSLFPKLTKLCLFNTTPFDELFWYGNYLQLVKYEFFNFEDIADWYPEVSKDINKLLHYTRDTDICKPYILKNSRLNPFFKAIKYLVLEEKLSFEHMDLFSMQGKHFSTEIIDFFIENYRKQIDNGYKQMYPFEEYFKQGGILSVNCDIANYIYEKEVFKIAFSHAVTNDEIAFTIVGKILCNITSLTLAKAIFEQAKFPILFEQEVNPLLILLNNNTCTDVPKIIELLCSLYPNLITLGDINGTLVKNSNNQYVHECNLLLKYIQNNGSRCSSAVLECFFRLGCDLKYVDLETNNNLLHICPNPCKFKNLEKSDIHH